MFLSYQPLYLSHFHISFHDVFLPYIRIPVRYILAAIQTNAPKVISIMNIETAICQYGTLNGILAIITIGELKGIMLAQTATELLGFEIAGVIKAIEKMISIVIGKLSD